MLECIRFISIVCIYMYAFLWSHAFIKKTHTYITTDLRTIQKMDAYNGN